jgi:hypothetical protein
VIAVAVGADDFAAIDRRAETLAEKLRPAREILFSLDECRAQDFPMLRFGGPAVRCGALFQGADNLGTDFTHGKLGHLMPALMRLQCQQYAYLNVETR